MTSLRDARLKRALDSAPDGQLLPGEAARRAVREAARQAVAPRGRAWWRFWEANEGGQRMPWNAALATVLLASLVTLLWQGQEVPPARPDATRADVPAPSAPSAPSAPLAPTAPTATPPAAVREAPAPAAAPPAGPAQPKSAAPSPRQEARDSAAASQAPARASADSLAKAAAPVADAPAQAEAAEKSVAAASPPPAPPAPRTAVAAAPQGATTGLASRREAFLAPGWTRLRLTARGRSVDLSREQATRLAELLDNLTARPLAPEALAEPVAARIELSRSTGAFGMLEIAGSQVRWLPVRGGGGTIRPEQALLQAIEEEIDRLLR